MALGRLLYWAYFKPVGVIRTSLREGGPVEQWKTERGRRAMEQAAHGLPAPVTSDKWRVTSASKVRGQSPEPERSADRATRRSNDPQTTGLRVKSSENSSHVTLHTSLSSGEKPLEVHMLVGTRFWFMAAFALVSLQRHIDRTLYAHFYDDGSLEPQQREKLEKLASKVTFHDRSEIEARIDQHLPEDKFPFIRERLRNYPNLKKLTDPHVGSTGPKLVMDADVLFFAEPSEMLQWLEKPEKVLCATDVTESYGYSRPLMQELAQGTIPEKINVGITGLQSESLDWMEIERWCRELITRERTSYYLEQALIAMLCASRPFTQLGLSRYITGPTDAQILAGQGVMQHYVDLSKKNYFRHAWRAFATRR